MQDKKMQDKKMQDKKMQDKKMQDKLICRPQDASRVVFNYSDIFL